VPLIGLPVHPLGLLRERFHHVRAPSEPPTDVLCPVQSPVHLVVSLALVDQIVAMTAQEILPRSVQDRDPPAASGSRTDEPGPLPTEVARRPGKGHWLPYVLPFSTRTVAVPVKKYHPLWPCVSLYRATDRARLPSGPRPTQGEPAPRRQQTLTVEIAHVQAMTLAGRGLLVEPEPVAAPYAAHLNVYVPLFAEIISEVYIEPVPVSTDCSYLWGFR
jgi:hypothetical protein